MVIALIELLTSIVLVSLKGVREKAKMAKAQEALQSIQTAIILAQDREDKVLGQITGNYCSECPCRNRADVCDLPDNSADSCIVNWRNAFNKIGLSPMRDLWGCPYMIDENELEGYEGVPCRHDTVNSAGPNRIYTGGPSSGLCTGYHDEEATPCDDDGPRVKIPFYQCLTSDIPCPDKTCPP